jgi:hypothetical protein
MDEGEADKPAQLRTLPTDIVLKIMGMLPDAASMASLCATSTSLAPFARHEVVWRSLVTKRWPYLATDTNPGSWRALHMARSHLPWRLSLSGHMDEVLAIVRQPAEVRQLSRLAQLLLAIFAGDEAVPHTHPEFQAWLGQLGAALDPTFCSQLSAYGNTLASRLDDFYEMPPCAALHRTLLEALRGASAMQLLHDDVLCKLTDAATAASTWSAADVPSSLAEITSSLSSLELEGFNIAVAPSLRPAALPRSHEWWFARMPVHAMGRLHHC